MIKYLLIFLLGFSLLANAVVEIYEFENDALHKRYQQFVDELRCPKCQNQNLSGSNSPIAEDLRRELHRLLHEGRSDQHIVDYMVARYGEFILYRPRFNAETAVLWLAPVIFLVLGIGIVVMVYLRQKKTARPDGQSDTLDTSEQQQLQNLLADKIDRDKPNA
ncbi:MAG: cytochrome c-type biogenesis protein [Pseudomonadales bacterium]